MNFLQKTAAALGDLRARYDAPLLKEITGVDALGRTRPNGFTFLGGNGPVWLGFDQALGRDQYQGVVYLIIASILRKAADVQWGVFIPGKNDERAAQVKANHPLVNFMWKPSLKEQSFADIIEEMGGYLLLTGNSYANAVVPDYGTFRGVYQELYPLPSDRVGPKLGRLYRDPVQGYSFRENDGSLVGFETTQIVHIKYWNPDGGPIGLSPVQAMGKMVTSADSGLNSQVRQFQNQGPAGIVYDESSTDPWTAEQSSGVRNWFNSYFPGGRRQGQLPIVGGKLGYLALGLSPTDLQVLDALQVTTRQLCSGFGYPAELLNDKAASTYNNVTEARKAAYTDAVLPFLRRLRDGLNRKLATKDGAYFDLITDGIPELQEDKKAQAEWLSTAWWVPVREKQRQMGIEVEDENSEMPKYLVPMTLSDPMAEPAPAVSDAPAPNQEQLT